MAELASRRDALRQAADLPGADVRALLEAALADLDAAIDTIPVSAPDRAAVQGELPGEAAPDAVRVERRLLHAVFQQAPVPLFLLEQDGTIRRANSKAGALLGLPAGYATGKALTALVDLPFRAAVQAQLAAVARTGKPRTASCRVLTSDGPLDVALAAAAADLPGDPAVLVVSVAPAPDAATAGQVAGPERGAPGEEPPDPAGDDSPAPAARADIAAMTRRLDTVTAVTRVLLDNSTFSEAVTLQRFARVLAGEIADWVVIDVTREGQLARQVVAGPRSGEADDLARLARSIDPDEESAPAVVHSSGKSLLSAHPDDPSLLGRGANGTPLLMMLGVTSLICVPISDGTAGYGALTLTRRADKGPFGVTDLGLAEELGRHLAIAIRTDRVFRQRSQVAEALQASLLPSRLPTVPGLEFAAAYIGATRWQEISGDFYDVFKAGGGWAIAIGDVCGKGQDAAAMTAAARHAIRTLAHVHKMPADVLSAANEVLLAEDYEDRFVTAALGFLRPRGRRVQVRLGSCGHPGPAIVRADGRVEVLAGDGLPLGLFDEAPPARAEAELRQGDVLFFYTDGVTEARSADREFFEDQFADALAAVAGRSAAEIVRAVQELVTSFSSGELADDVTIVAVRVEGLVTSPDGVRLHRLSFPGGLGPPSSGVMKSGPRRTGGSAGG